MINSFSQISRRRSKKLSFAKGYTTLEVVIGATLSALLVAAIITWAGGIGRVVSNEVNVSDNGRTELAIMRLHDDLLSATFCNSSALDSPIRSMGRYNLEFVGEVDGVKKFISWKFVDSELVRGESVLPADCSSPLVATYSSMVTDVELERSGFYPVRDGVRGSSPADYISCEDRFTEGCFIDSVLIDVYRLKNNELRSATISLTI